MVSEDKVKELLENVKTLLDALEGVNVSGDEYKLRQIDSAHMKLRGLTFDFEPTPYEIYDKHTKRLYSNFQQAQERYEEIEREVLSDEVKKQAKFEVKEAEEKYQNSMKIRDALSEEKFKENKLQDVFTDMKSKLKQTYEDSKEYINFLTSNLKWKKYSVSNKLYLWMQCRFNGYEGRYLNTFNGWKELGFAVQKGEKAMELLHPSIKKYFKNEEGKWLELSEATKEEKEKIKLGKLETREEIKSFFFRKSVFDIAQTNCPVEEYEERIREKLIPKDLEESQDKKVDFLFNSLKTHLIQNEKINLKVEELGDIKGYVDFNKNIALNTTNSNLQNLKTIVHEYAHYKLHMKEDQKLMKYQKEVEAESVAYLVCKNFGIDTSDYSFKYIAAYGAENTEDDLYKSYERIMKTADSINNILEKALAVELEKEQGQEINSGDIVIMKSLEDDNRQDRYFIADAFEDVYMAYKVTETDEKSIAAVKLPKDSNSLNKNLNVRMDMRYPMKIENLVSKVGKFNKAALERLNMYQDIFYKKKLVNEFNPATVKKLENKISMKNQLTMGR